MSISIPSSSCEHTCSKSHSLVVDSPSLGVTIPGPSSGSVSNSPEVYSRMDLKKRANCETPTTEESKRQRLSYDSTESGFSLASEVSIFDADGLISLPFPLSQEGEVATGVNDTVVSKDPSACTSQYDLFHTEPPPLQLLGTQPVQGQPEPFMPRLDGSISLSDAMSACSSPPAAQVSSPAQLSAKSLSSSSDASMLQLTISGMMTCLRRVSELASANPQQVMESDVYHQVAAANQIVAGVVQRMAASSNSESPMSPAAVTPPIPSVFEHSVPEPPPSVSHSRQLRVSEMETLWYADRPYPTVEVEVVDGATGQRISDLNDRRIQVSLVDGNGQPCDKLSGHALSFGFAFPVIDGAAEISGIRFSAVSSKFGGHFQLRFELVSEYADPPAQQFTSPRLQVLSYRLFHAPKVDFSKLRPSDPLSKVKGIGSLYAKRFAAIGIRTVAELAELEVDSLDSGDEASVKLLECLRRDRGALTLTKLTEYIAQAKDIVGRQSGFSISCDGASVVPLM